MVAAAPSLPTLSPEHIARDVALETNPRTGAHEFLGAPFDPFEEDPALAGALRLRSADGAVALDGRPLRDGAIVEVDFYYNSPSDDPYGGRKYGDAAFVDGELAPVVLRDTRILECSTRAEDVVYHHANYYGPSYSRGVGVYRPYQHYTGHSGFGFGFGSSYFGPGYGSSSTSFFGNSFTSGSRTAFGRGSSARRVRGRDTRRESREERRDRREEAQEQRADNGEGQTSRPRTRNGLTDQEIDARLNRARSYGVGRTRSGIARNARASGSQPAVNAQPRISTVQSAAPSVSPTSAPAASSSAARSTVTSAPAAQSPEASRQTGTRRTRAERPQTRRNESRRNDTRRSEPRSNSSTRSPSTRTRPKKTSTPRRRISSRNIKRQLNFFPNDGYSNRAVVTSYSVDCAREDKLRVFIPNERLTAARFDGLTLVALDAQGRETPIYLPPNYIEGFRLASSGQVQPQGYEVLPQYRQPQIAPRSSSVPHGSSSLPSHRIEAAPCPAGTTKQANGTCLQTNSGGYPG